MGFNCPKCGHHFYIQGGQPQGVTRMQGRVMGCFMQRLVDGLPSPTVAELAADLGLKSAHSAHRHVSALVERGFLSRVGGKGRARSVRVTEAGFALYPPKEARDAA